MSPNRLRTLALVQMRSVSDEHANLGKMRRYFDLAVAQNATLVCFPEMAYFMGDAEGKKRIASEHDRLLAEFREWAREKRVYFCPGTLREPAPRGKCFNTAYVIDPMGEVVAKYRKIFLFRARLADRYYDEALECEAGDRIVTLNWDGITVGLAICFDLRFPEMFRALRKQGAQVVLLPSAFTVPTGHAHWESLLRARAIENQCFIGAPAQVGMAGDGAAKFGHSRWLDPWGTTLAQMDGEKENLLVCALEPSAIAAATERIDAWGARREDLFPIA